MSNETAPAPESAGAGSPVKVKVAVVQQAVKHEGKVYLKNQILEVTPERAAALGDFVKPYVAPKPKEKKKVAPPAKAEVPPAKPPTAPVVTKPAAK